MCICSFENESTTQFFLHCHFYIPIRATLLDKLQEIVNNLQELSNQIKLLLKCCYMVVQILKAIKTLKFWNVPLSILCIQRDLPVLF